MVRGSPASDLHFRLARMSSPPSSFPSTNISAAMPEHYVVTNSKWHHAYNESYGLLSNMSGVGDQKFGGTKFNKITTNSILK